MSIHRREDIFSNVSFHLLHRHVPTRQVSFKSLEFPLYICPMVSLWMHALN